MFILPIIKIPLHYVFHLKCATTKLWVIVLAKK